MKEQPACPVNPATDKSSEKPAPASPVRPGDRIDLRIDGISQESQGIGRYQGLAVFVPETIPGDQVRVLVEKKMSRYAVGRPIKLLEPSPDRIAAVCPQAGECGGCSLQMMAYPAQLRFKEQQVVDALERIGHVPDARSLTRPIIGMDHPWHYRAKVQFPIAGSSVQPTIGFYATGSHRVVPVSTCPIQPPVADAIRDAVSRHIIEHQIAPYDETTHTGLLRHLVARIGFFTGEVMVMLVVNGNSLPAWQDLYASLQAVIAASSDPDLPPLHLDSFYLNINLARTNLILADDCRLLAGQPWIEEKILGLRYRISPLAFFQVNPRQTERLYAAVLEMAGLTGSETVLDLYCGTGSITLQLARQAREVIGIEVVAAAIEDARVNAELNNSANVRFLTGAAETVLPELIQDGLRADAAVIDPPRKGCDGGLIQALIALNPQRIVYVSCNPATLARDIALLQPAGYRVQAVQPVDMFPWTGHVEAIILLQRVES